MRMTYQDMQKRVARYLGYGEVSTAWSEEQENQLERIVVDGVRQFLTPDTVVIHGREVSHEWSFTKRRNGSIDTVAGTTEYEFPAGVGADIIGPMTFSADSGYPPLVRVTDGDIRRMRSESDDQGRPRVWCVRILNFGGVGEPAVQRIDLYPTPDAVYTLSFQTQQQWNEPFAGDLITSPASPPFFDEAILSSCLAVAEREFEDGGNGIHQQEYQRKLSTAVRRDIETNAPDTHGSFNTHGAACDGSRHSGIRHGHGIYGTHEDRRGGL